MDDPFVFLGLLALACFCGVWIGWNLERDLHQKRRAAVEIKIDTSEFERRLEDLRQTLIGAPHRVDCSWCGQTISGGREPISHGICEECARANFGIDLSELERKAS